MREGSPGGRTADPPAVAALIARAKAYDRDAFGMLYRQTVTPVYRYVASRVRTAEDAEEVTQEVFVAALAGIRGLRAADEAALYAWLYQIARYKLADHLRARYRRPTAPLEEAPEPVDAAPAVEDVLAERDGRQELRERMRDAMAQLTDEQREVMTYRYVLGYGNQQLAETLGKNVNAVNQLHHRALRSLHRLLTAEERAR